MHLSDRPSAHPGPNPSRATHTATVQWNPDVWGQEPVRRLIHVSLIRMSLAGEPGVLCWAMVGGLYLHRWRADTGECVRATIRGPLDISSLAPYSGPPPLDPPAIRSTRLPEPPEPPEPT